MATESQGAIAYDFTIYEFSELNDLIYGLEVVLSPDGSVNTLAED